MTLKLKIIYLFVIYSIFCSNFCFAGNQKFENLSNNYKDYLSSMINANSYTDISFKSDLHKKYWIEYNKLKLNKYKKNFYDAESFLLLIHYEAVRAGLEPSVVLGLIEVESGFKKYSISSVGATGIMQVMPFWKKSIGNDNDNLFNIKTNLRYGCSILRYYLDIENGNLRKALARYNGSVGKNEYPNAVLSASKKYL